MAMRYSLRSDPSNPTGASLPVRWEIIAPEGTTNIFTNPSWETNTSGWTATSDGSGGTPYARAATYQFKGAYSAAMTIQPTNGTYSQIANSITMSTSTQYSMQFHVRRANRGEIRSSQVRAYVNGGLADFDRIVYVADGWYRCEKTWLSISTSGVGIRLVGSPGQVFYVDAAQLETKGYCTTYCDGDQVGLLPVEVPPPFIWTGTPHASTSIRTAQTRAGGRPLDVSRYGLEIKAVIGLGLSQRSVISTPLGLADGSLYQRTIRDARVFTVAGAFEGSGPRDLSARRGALRSLLSHDLSGLDQPVMMRLQRYDGRDPMGNQVILTASYLEGLGEDMTQPFDEKVSIQFEQYAPGLASAADRGGVITSQVSVSNANRIIRHSPNGSWSALVTGMNNTVTGLLSARDGLLYAIGTFSTAGGVSAAGIATWNGSAWSALGSGISSANALAEGPSGIIYVTGVFTTAGGGAANRIASWNGSVWAALGSGLGAAGNAIAIAENGDVYVGGGFTTAGGGAANYVAVWNGSTWAALGSGLSADVNTVAIGPDGRVYVGGSFTSAGGNPANRIAVWDGSSWSALSSGLNGTVRAMAFDQVGNLYIGGDFTTAGGIAVNYAAVWNGIAWGALGAGVAGGSPTVTDIAAGPQGMYFGGAWDSVDGIPTPDGAAIYNQNSWTPVPVDFPSTATLRSVAFGRDASIYFGWDTGGTATVEGVTAISSPSTVPTGARIVINGPPSGSSRLYSIANATTGRALYFDLALNAGEIAVLTIANGTVSFSSNFRPDLASALLPASDAGFLLVKGDNRITMFAASSLTATLSLTPQYESLDDATMTPALQ